MQLEVRVPVARDLFRGRFLFDGVFFAFRGGDQGVGFLKDERLDFGNLIGGEQLGALGALDDAFDFRGQFELNGRLRVDIIERRRLGIELGELVHSGGLNDLFCGAFDAARGDLVRGQGARPVVDAVDEHAVRADSGIRVSDNQRLAFGVNFARVRGLGDGKPVDVEEELARLAVAHGDEIAHNAVHDGLGRRAVFGVLLFADVEGKSSFLPIVVDAKTVVPAVSDGEYHAVNGVAVAPFAARLEELDARADGKRAAGDVGRFADFGVVAELPADVDGEVLREQRLRGEYARKERDGRAQSDRNEMFHR